MAENHHHHHHDGHHHDHHDHHHKKSELSFEEQLETLFKHWINHNESHGKTYKEWSDKANDKKMENIGKILDEVASMTDGINVKIKEALELIRS